MPIPAILKYPIFLDTKVIAKDTHNKNSVNSLFLFSSGKLTSPPLEDHLYIIRH